MIKVTLDNGFKCEINEAALDDMRLIRLLGKVDGQPWLLDEVACKLIGEDGFEKLNKHLETEDGRIPTTEFSLALREILAKGGESVKKS